MDIIGVRIEEAYVVTEIALSELKLLKKALDNTTLNYNSEKEDEVQYYATYMHFYEFIKGAIEGCEDESV